MDKTELQQKLTQPFDPIRWKDVVESVFPGSQFYSQDRDIPSGEEIVERFAEKGFIRLADGKNLALVELRLKKGSVQLPKNRVKLRGLVAGLIDQERAHGVIAIFEQGGNDYRLSFVAKEAVIEDGEFKTRETPAKRYTYLLGPGETCRTAAERLHALGQKKELQLADVTDAFNVEKLNKQFFKDYQAQYEKFCAFLASPENGYRKTVFGIPAKADGKEEKPIRDFVKRLLGRLVFLQFLQKKGWMGCPADSRHWTNGDRQFLQSFFAGCVDQKHFHSAFLTPLFYDALNRENRADDVFELTSSRIPYLNGGLFEDDLPATRAIDFPPAFFGELLDCFGAYNFTIDENDPMDAEVGIDPEMLGHIFENLLEDNKDKGAYYTPKAIVHYMCQESLLQYLKTGLELIPESSEREPPANHADEALAKPPLEDPAREDARPPNLQITPDSLMEGERPREPFRGFARASPIEKSSLAGVLNSTVVRFFFGSICPRVRGDFMRFKTVYVSQIPIPAATAAQQKKIEALVEQILALKKQTPDADVSALEADIDRLVYKLYNLSEAEIAIVEGKE